ncbi:major facilitator superfamily domain-containing protein [Bipolaris maydis]|nr:major facilitator superfamily domain-containing protein [Bipolaris maydis]
MPTVPDRASATATDPPLCGICPNGATITCSGCDNMKYCSVTCQQRDAAQHSMLCSTFQDFQERPSPNHFRSIYFPVDELNPRFIWLRMMGTRGSHVVDDEDLSQYVSGNQSGGICTSSHYGITPEREYKTMIVVQHDGNMFGNFQVVNWCLLYLLGPEAHRWRGGSRDSNGASTSRVASGYGSTRTGFRNDSGEQESRCNSETARSADTRNTSRSIENNTEGAAGLSSKQRNRPHDLSINTNVTDTDTQNGDDTGKTESANRPVSWSALPRKDQLFVLVLARFSEPLTQTSLGAYLYYQLQSFDPSLSESTLSYQAGIIGATFPATQFLTAILWGRFSDSEYGGRKRTIYLGLVGTMLSTIGFGFSHNFAMAVFFRSLGGIVNGNIGVMRTMISEIIKEKKFQSRAFLLMPMTFNVGVLIGPVLGGILADPVANYPSLFGPESTFGGKHGVQWMMRYPYALPNLVSAMFLFFSSLAVLFFLEETGELCKDRPDFGLRMGRWIRRTIFRQDIASERGYSIIPSHDLELQQTPTSPTVHQIDEPSKQVRQQLPFRRIWTPNLIMTMLAHGALAMHVSTFNGLWTLHLSTSRFDSEHPYPPSFKPHGLFFTGGLGMPPSRIGLALAIIGIIGLPLQIFVYPKIAHRLGTTNSFRIFTAFFPLMYFVTPFLSLVPSWTPPPLGVSGPWIWIAITAALSIQVLARTFALPCTAILINNASPHPSVLGTVHGIGQSVSSLTRTFGPVFFSWLFGKGLERGMVGLAWWCMGLVAVGGWVLAQGVREGDGHEILLEGERKEGE